jgi:hypothetical protein
VTYGLGIDGVRPKVVMTGQGWLGLAMAVECDHCKGRRMEHGVDDRSDDYVRCGLFVVEPWNGNLELGALLGVLFHLAFQHSALPVREMDVGAVIQDNPWRGVN